MDQSLAQHINRSEEPLDASIFENAPIGMALVNPDGRIQKCNPRLQYLTGYSQEELRSRSFQDITHPDDVAKDVRKFDSLMNGSISDYKMIKRYIRKNGSIMWGELHVNIIRSETGAPKWIIGMVKDISYERRKTLELEKIKELLEKELTKNLVAHHMGSFGYYEMDLSRNTISGSAESYSLLGLTPDSQNFDLGIISEIISKTDYERVLNDFKKAISHKSDFESEFKCINQKTGDVIHIKTKAILSGLHNSLKVFGIIQDVTEQRRLLKKLQDSNDLLTEFTYTISHDLKEPVRSVSGLLTLIKKEIGNELDDTIKHHFDLVIENAVRLTKMIDALLEYSRSGNISSEPVLVSLKSKIERVKRALNNQMADRNARIISYVDDIHIKAYPEQLFSMLQNLISNGIKYNSSEKPTIIIDYFKTQDYHIINVSDNGDGIKPDHQDEIFKIFNRGREPKFKSGSGMGLAICKKMAETMGGDVHLLRSTEKGSVFSIHISKKIKY